MEITPKGLALWFKSNPKWNRKDFCEELGISIKTSYMWTAGSVPISEKHIPTIEKMMAGTYGRKSNTITLRIDMDDYAELEKVAFRKGYTLSQFIKIMYMRELEFSEREIQEEMKRCPSDS